MWNIVPRLRRTDVQRGGYSTCLCYILATDGSQLNRTWLRHVPQIGLYVIVIAVVCNAPVAHSPGLA